MYNRIGIYIVLLAMACMSVACNDDSDDTVTSVDYSSTMVSSFALKSNSEILNNLDSVFFAIDLVNAQIFNADSLPYGTKVSRLQVSINTDGCSAVEIIMPGVMQADTTVNYLSDPNDSIDFSRGYVTLHVASYDKMAMRDYQVKVNVHTQVADSLVWDVNGPALLPTSLTTPVAQRTVSYGGKVYTYTVDAAGGACVAVADTPYSVPEYKVVNFGFTPQLEMLTATSTSMYVLDEAGMLYASSDGENWSSCGEVWRSITVSYGSALIGVAEQGGKLYHVSYPAVAGGESQEVDAAFPVSGNSQSFSFTSDWSTQMQVITVGGRKADGSVAPGVWSYDGRQWACLNADTPMAADGQVVFPYYCCQTDTNTWRVSSKSVIVAMGGLRADGVIQDSVYISYDLGFNWSKAPQSMQLPKTLPLVYDAQVVVAVESMPRGRAVKPITEWDTPYIYMYGGRTVDGTLSAKVYRGVVNRLVYKPLQ